MLRMILPLISLIITIVLIALFVKSKKKSVKIISLFVALVVAFFVLLVLFGGFLSIPANVNKQGVETIANMLLSKDEFNMYSYMNDIYNMDITVDILTEETEEIFDDNDMLDDFGEHIKSVYGYNSIFARRWEKDGVKYCITPIRSTVTFYNFFAPQSTQGCIYIEKGNSRILINYEYISDFSGELFPSEVFYRPQIDLSEITMAELEDGAFY